MQHKQFKISLIFLLGLGLTNSQAQESLNTTGNNDSNNNGSVSYSVGQITYQTNTGTNGSVIEGVQQPYKISVVTDIEEAKNINLSIAAYPNPTTNYLTLEVKNFELSNLNFQLLDIRGKLLQKKKITDSQTKIIMNNLVPATYFVKIIQKNKEVKTFKIIKN